MRLICLDIIYLNNISFSFSFTFSSLLLCLYMLLNAEKMIHSNNNKMPCSNKNEQSIERIIPLPSVLIGNKKTLKSMSN
jgi:hypothetical protein